MGGTSSAAVGANFVETFLSHKVAGGESGGGGKFEESKVKRDGRGRFSKIAARFDKREEKLIAEFEKMLHEKYGQYGPELFEAKSEKEARALLPSGQADEIIESIKRDTGKHLEEYYALRERRAEALKHDGIVEDDVSDYLAHYGVKGMKWGVRKSSSSGAIKPRATLGIRDRRAEKWKLTAETKAYAKVYRRSASRIRQGTRKLNNDPRFKGQDFRKDSPIRRKYYDEYSKMVSDQLNATVRSRSMVLPTRRLGMSPNKRLELKFHYDLNQEAKPRVTVRRADTRTGRKDTRSDDKQTRSEVKHADIDTDEELELFLVLDDSGHIQDLDAPEVDDDDELEQSDLVDDFLAHYGVKGMKWGVRRRSSSGPSSSDVSDDYRTAAAARSKHPATLSNQEMQALINRMNLERQYAQVMSTQSQKPATKGRAVKKFVGNLLVDIGRNEVTRVVRTASAIAVENALTGDSKNVKGKDFAKAVGVRMQPSKKKK